MDSFYSHIHDVRMAANPSSSNSTEGIIEHFHIACYVENFDSNPKKVCCLHLVYENHSIHVAPVSACNNRHVPCPERAPNIIYPVGISQKVWTKH